MQGVCVSVAASGKALSSMHQGRAFGRFTATAANGKPGHGWCWGHAHAAQDVAVGCDRRARGFLWSRSSAWPEQGARVTQGVSAQRLQSCGCSLCAGARGPRSVPCFSPALLLPLGKPPQFPAPQRHRVPCAAAAALSSPRGRAGLGRVRGTVTGASLLNLLGLASVLG